MFKIPLSEIKKKILQKGKLDAKNLEEKIRHKINELSGLISEEGAAHIIANELGIELIPSDGERLKIKDVYAGMRTVTIVGKVVRKFEVREFAKGESTGKVCSLVLGDESGTVRVVFWNEQVDLLDKVQENDVLKVINAYVRDNRGNKEVHLGQRGEIEVNPKGEKVSSVRETNSHERKTIADLSSDGEQAEILATVVQVFDPRFFYVCPRCNKRVTGEGIYSCQDHGEVEPSLSYVLNLVVDDGSGNIRCVFWKNQTNCLLRKEEEELSKYKENPAIFEGVKNDLLGEQFKLLGRVNKNEMFGRLEFSVQIVEKADPEKELARLQKL